MFRTIRLILILIILFVLGVGIYTLTGGGRQQGLPPTVTTVTQALAPVSRGDIVSQFKVITVERQYNIPVLGTAYREMPNPQRNGALGAMVKALVGGRERVPGTTEQIVYEMVTTVTAGIDMNRLTDQSVVNGATETTVTLPRPEVFSVVTDFEKSGVKYRSSPKMPFMSHSSQLIADLQKTGEKKHRLEATRDEDFMGKARSEAEKSIRGLLQKAHPERRINITFN